MLLEIIQESAIAISCGRSYVFGVTDLVLHNELINIAPPGVDLRLISI